jgi:RNA polymerase sigma factor (sigma-70 family)
MPAAPLCNVVQHLRGLTGHEMTDQQLLQRFTLSGDEASFTALVRRHGPLVLGVCRRLLGEGPDLEDAFQATFVVLLRKAGAIRKQASVGSWLHGVAHRLSLQLRTRRGRRQRREYPLDEGCQTTGDGPAVSAGLRELGAILDEELQRLPAGCREALVLCHLEGLSHAEAAKQLHWPLGTLKGRIGRARNLLRQRLQRRGVTLSALGLTLALAEQSSAAVPAELVRAVLHCRLEAAVPTEVRLLADAAGKMLGLSRIRLALVAILAVGLVGLGTALTPLIGARDDVANSTTVASTLPQEQKTAVATDAQGDPLPPGAIARLGTIRWRHASAVYFISMLADAKTVVSAADDRYVRIWDLASGKQLHRFGPGPMPELPRAGFGPVPVGARMTGVLAAVSHDGKLVAAHFDGPAIELREIAGAKKVGEVALGKIRVEEMAAITFAPDNKHLAIGSNVGPIRVLEIATGKVTQEFGKLPAADNLRLVTGGQGAVRYSPTGKALAALFTDIDNMPLASVLRCWDVESGREQWTIKAPRNFGMHSPVWSPDGKLFAHGNPDSEICLLDAESGKELRRWKTLGPMWPMMVFGADSTKLYSKCAGEAVVREWDVATGKELRQLGDGSKSPGFVGPNRCLTLAPDGKTLAVGDGASSLRFIDVTSGKDTAVIGGHSNHVQFLSYTTDGKSIMTRGGDFKLRWWNTATGKELQQVAVSAASFVNSADGRIMAANTPDHGIEISDPVTGKKLGAIAGKPSTFPMFVLSPDGRALFVRRFDVPGQVLVYELPSCKEVYRITVGDRPASMFFSADGRRFGLHLDTKALAIHETATGKLLRSMELADGVTVQGAAFSPDERTAALDQGNGVVILLELATGKERCSFGKKTAGMGGDGMMTAPVSPYSVKGIGVRLGPVFSPDGRLLAVPAAEVLEVFDTATGKQLARFEGHQGQIGSVAFAPDGRTVATGSADTTALVWDVEGLRQKATPQPRVLDAADVEARWSDLESGDARKAAAAINALVASPEQAVAFLKTRLKPAAAVATETIDKLIAQLDSADFKGRQQAQSELLRIGEAALPRITKELARKPALEMRQRLETLEASLTVSAVTGERLRLIRAIEVLEHIGDTEARRVLQALADGAPDALGTVQAQAAIKRLR